MRPGPDPELTALSRTVLRLAEAAGNPVATAESCTGGYLAALLSGAEGVSHLFAAGLVVYSDDAKTRLLQIPRASIDRYGAVSREIVQAMAGAALEVTGAGIAVAVSGYTGPPGEQENGLVHFAVANRSGASVHLERRFGDVTRDAGRRLAAMQALTLLRDCLEAGGPAHGSKACVS
jgi:nicotinamide-nucleotide amidase